MGILTNLTRMLIAGSFDFLDKYLDRKWQERADKKAFEALGKYQNYLFQQYGPEYQNQGGVLPTFNFPDNPNSRKGVLPQEGFNDTGMQPQSHYQLRQPIVDYRSGRMYFPIAGPGNFYQDEDGNLVQP